MHSNDVVMMARTASKTVLRMDEATAAVAAMKIDIHAAAAHMEQLERLLEEAAQVEGPLSADLRERMADAVSL